MRGLGLVAVALIASLSACSTMEGAAPQGLSFLSQGSSNGLFQRRLPLRTATVADGAVRIVGPDGYCIDRASYAPRPVGSVAILASCDTLTSGRGQLLVAPVVMTVTVGGPAAPDLVLTADVLEQVTGAQATDTREGEDLVLARMETGGSGYFEGATEAHWRGLALAGGHLVSLAVYGRGDSGVEGELGASLLADLAAAMQAESPGPQAVPVTVAESAPTPPQGLLQRLFQ